MLRTGTVAVTWRTLLEQVEDGGNRLKDSIVAQHPADQENSSGGNTPTATMGAWNFMPL
jgi:hypothetical protein